MNQQEIKNEKLKEYKFLAEMYEDDYFPDFLVNKCKAILVSLCLTIETNLPADVEALYPLTHAATEKFNDMEEEFDEHDSEIETAARECIALDFECIAHAYGFVAADMEELIAPRDW